jgi:5'-nucleotidase/UDP-sugar diphosphatase
MKRLWTVLMWAVLVASGRSVERKEAIEALVVVVADQHSAYERAAQLVARVDRLKADNPGVPLAVMIDGDAFELGNGVAKRSGGAIDFAIFRALAQRAPTVLNLGNHEPEFAGMAETVERLRETGIVVIGNAVNRATGQLFAPSSTRVRLGMHDAVIVGITTDDLATYRAAIRPTLDLVAPAVWAKQNLPELYANAEVRVLLSHAGLAADRSILPILPDGTLFAGAHDHLRFVHRSGQTVYFHSGSWNTFVSIASLSRTGDALTWNVEQAEISVDDPADAAISSAIAETSKQFLTDEDRVVLGSLDRAMNPTDAARWVVASVRCAAAVDAAFIGATTFGGGLPAAGVTRAALDSCVRFDGGISTGEIDGATLKAILGRANQGPDTPFEERRGENLVCDAIAGIEPDRRYRIAVSDWIARNPKKYLGVDTIELTPQPELRLKAIAAAELSKK